MDLQTQLYIAQAIHNFGPGTLGGVAYVMFLITLGEALTIGKVIAYITLSALTGYVIYVLTTTLYAKFALAMSISATKDSELIRIVSGLGGFLHKYVIDGVIRWTPKFIDNYAEKGIK